MQVRLGGGGAFPPSSAVEPGFLVNPGFLLFLTGKNPAYLHGADRRGLKKGNENQAWRFRAVKVAAPAVATKVAAMSTSDPKPVLANSERFGE